MQITNLKTFLGIPLERRRMWDRGAGIGGWGNKGHRSYFDDKMRMKIDFIVISRTC